MREGGGSKESRPHHPDLPPPCAPPQFCKVLVDLEDDMLSDPLKQTGRSPTPKRTLNSVPTPDRFTNASYKPGACAPARACLHSAPHLRWPVALAVSRGTTVGRHCPAHVQTVDCSCIIILVKLS